MRKVPSATPTAEAQPRPPVTADEQVGVGEARLAVGDLAGDVGPTRDRHSRERRIGIGDIDAKRGVLGHQAAARTVGAIGEVAGLGLLGAWDHVAEDHPVFTRDQPVDGEVAGAVDRRPGGRWAVHDGFDCRWTGEGHAPADGPPANEGDIDAGRVAVRHRHDGRFGLGKPDRAIDDRTAVEIGSVGRRDEELVIAGPEPGDPIRAVGRGRRASAAGIAIR